MRKCPVCEGEIKGRLGKIFCSLRCKSIDQYEKRQVEEAFFIQVDKQLKINRKVLKKYNRSGFTTLRKEQLEKEGFDSNFFTHYWKNSKGEVYLFCYDFGFLEIEQNGVKKYLLVEWQQYMRK